MKQPTRLAIAIRGHLAEYGWAAPKGAAHLAMLADLLEDGEVGEILPEAARPMFAMMVGMLAELGKRLQRWKRKSRVEPAKMRSRAG